MAATEPVAFTTGEVARLCGVTIKTVIRWFESGELRGFKIPGSRDRRIPRAHLIEFMRSHGIPLGELESGALPARRKRLMIVDDDPLILATLATYFQAGNEFDIATATNGYAAGMLTASFRPDALLLDFNLGDATGLDVAQAIRSNPELARTRILCMSGIVDEVQAKELLSRGIDDFVRKPFDLVDVKRRIVRLLGLPQSA